MDKLKEILAEVGYDDTNNYFKNAYIKKVIFNEQSFSYTIVIFSKKPLNPQSFLELQAKFLEYKKNFKLQYMFEEKTNQKAFQVYWDEVFVKEFVGKELHDMNVVPQIKDNKTLILHFNLQSELNQFLHWKDTVQKKIKEFGYDFKVDYLLKDNIEDYKMSIKTATSKILDAKITNAKFVKMAQDYKDKPRQKINNNNGKSIKISDINSSGVKNITLLAQITSIDSRNITNKNLVIYKIGLFDKTKAIFSKYFFSKKSNYQDPISKLKKHDWVLVGGDVEYDSYDKELMIIIKKISKSAPEVVKSDKAKQKRIEFATHTQMSAFDGVGSVSEIIKYALALEHNVIGFADQDNVQAYPEIYNEFKIVKKDFPAFKILYGVILKMINSNLNLATNQSDLLIDETTFVILDIETTGLSAQYDEIIEFGALKVRNGSVMGRESFFVKAKKPIPDFVKKLTGINQDMVDNGLDPKEAAERIYNFIKDTTLIAHNANFDISFISKLFLKHHLGMLQNPWVDTVHLSWLLTKPKKSYRLSKIAWELNVQYQDTVAHRADYDAEVLSLVFDRLLSTLKRKHPEIKKLEQLKTIVKSEHLVKQYGFNINIYAKNNAGIKTIYELVSKAHTSYVSNDKSVFLPKEIIEKDRKNIIVGSGANGSEIIEYALFKTYFELEQVIDFYDFVIINPLGHFKHYVEKEQIESMEIIEGAIKKIIKIAKEKNKLIIASSNPFYVKKEDKIYRNIYIETKRLGGRPHPLKDFSNKTKTFPEAYYKTTQELLEDFEFLGKDVAQQIVCRNPAILNETIDNDITPIKEGLFVPKLENSKKIINDLATNKAIEKYGKTFPTVVGKRLKKELDAILENNFDTIYYASHLLVKKSLDQGYLVGSRGSVGSSFVAWLTNITEVNPLPPHYSCQCSYSNFDVLEKYKNGFDLPPISCPKCKATMYGQGHNIPFETFLGFDGTKIPDIDLNFSGEYQPMAHQHAKEMFGAKNVFRAGTISTVQNRTAYGYVMSYFEQTLQNEKKSKAEIDRLISGITGTKRTTGQHPGGIMVVPDEYDIYDFTPLNYPANEVSEWKTTHFDYHSIHDNLLKLDLLGHIDPTAIRMLQDITGIDPNDIPFYDPDVLAIFSNQTTLKLKSEFPIDEITGAIGIPEFGTQFVRQMLAETKPKSFNELIILSGLSHGTGVYRGNSRELILDEKKEMTEVIGCRDDIMLFLIEKGLSNKDAFDIMEFIRKGFIMTKPSQWANMVQKMTEHNVADWWIKSCNKINYLFPKAHATAYVMMAWRVAWFKVYYPLEYYATLFTLRIDAFDINTILKGESYVLEKYQNLKDAFNQSKSNLTPKDIELLKGFEMAIEMFARGYSFSNIDLEKSQSQTFVVDKSKQVIIIPFNAIDGLGAKVADTIIQARKALPFSSMKDLLSRTKINKTQFQQLKELNVLSKLPPDDQTSIFDFVN